MKLFAFAVLLVCAVFVTGQESYPDRYDNIDVDEILSNQRLYQKYFDCVMGKGKCTPDGAELKDKIPEALKNECAQCNEKQKKGAEKVLRFLITQKKDDFKLLEEKYDPEGIYRKKYEEQRKALEEGKDVKV
uniref:Chemosensory protein 6 n=1 Tax=Cyrtorhinus lividipennis TaxID=1032904 RepID=A0A346TI02_9HEMI|nr:chemosensory protein 6 [Cyrtorhinus lividipennis]